MGYFQQATKCEIRHYDVISVHINSKVLAKRQGKSLKRLPTWTEGRNIETMAAEDVVNGKVLQQSGFIALGPTKG